MLYDDHYQVLEILCERWAHGAHQYLVKWQHHRVRNDHIQVLTSAPLSYTARECLPLSGAEDGWSEVLWANSWEPEE